MKKKNYKFKLKDIWDVENTFYLKSDISRLSKTICHYEIFKKTTSIPGSIVECGVFKGVSLIRFISFRNLIIRNSKKKVYGFDAFGKFPKQKINRDNKFARYHDKKAGIGISHIILKKFISKKKLKNFQLFKGDVKKTLPNFLKRNPKLKISFLHIDLDVYEPTKFVLETLFSRVSVGGVILIDDYGLIKGATNATNFFLKKNKKLKLQTLNFYKKLKFIIKDKK